MRKYIASLILVVALPIAFAMSAPSAVPPTALKEIDQLFAPPAEKLPPDELAKLLTERMTKVVELAGLAEKTYPDAPNLHEVQLRHLRAADMLDRQKKDQPSRQGLLDISKAIMAGKAPCEAKVQADFFLTRERIAPCTGPSQVKDVPAEIRQYTQRYEKTSAQTPSLVYGAMLATMTQQTAIRNELLDKLEASCGQDEQVQAFLKRMGRNVQTAQGFQADLKLLDGSALKLPDDLAGKVVIVDFWATWCGPCRASIPELRDIYAKYKDKGLEIVSISLDGDRAALEKFVRDNNMIWKQAFSGQAGSDPTAVKYNIRAIPSVWVLDRGGKVVSDSARSNLEEIVKKAIEQAAPAKKVAATP